MISIKKIKADSYKNNKLSRKEKNELMYHIRKAWNQIEEEEETGNVIETERANDKTNPEIIISIHQHSILNRTEANRGNRPTKNVLIHKTYIKYVIPAQAIAIIGMTCYIVFLLNKKRPDKTEEDSDGDKEITPNVRISEKWLDDKWMSQLKQTVSGAQEDFTSRTGAKGSLVRAKDEIKTLEQWIKEINEAEETV